jgi:hypothetical protein
VSLTYQVFAPANPNEIVQLFMTESWSTSWPPASSYVIQLYNGIPGVSPGVTTTRTVTFTAPSAPGTYYLWLNVDSQFTMQNAINHKTTPMNELPSHIKINVTNTPTPTSTSASSTSMSIVTTIISALATMNLTRRRKITIFSFFNIN